MICHPAYINPVDKPSPEEIVMEALTAADIKYLGDPEAYYKKGYAFEIVERLRSAGMIND